MLTTLQRWRDSGALRALDLAFVRLLHELEPDAPGSLLLAAALAAQLEGRGHACADLDLLADAFADWPAALRAELSALLPLDTAAWGASALIRIDPANCPGASPLVLHGTRLYLRRCWQQESGIAARVLARTAAGAAPFDATDARLWLDRLFPPARRAAETDGQRAACERALDGRLTLITGGPGTGKTFTAARLLVLLQALHRGPQPLRVALAAPTGKAAARLRQAIDTALHELRARIEPGLFGHDPTAAPGAARTLHALLGARHDTRRLRHDASHPLDVDLLFVDEASMVHLELMAALLDALPPAAHLVLLGDADQLASVEAGAVLGELCASAALASRVAVLRRSHRFGGPIAALAAAVNDGDAAAVRQALAAGSDDGDGVVAWPPRAHDAAGLRALAVTGYRGYLEPLRRRPADAAAFEPWAMDVLREFDRFRVLCALRAGPHGAAGLNAAIEQALADAGLLPSWRCDWYEGRPVMVTRNDASIGVFNGDIGIVLRAPGAAAGSAPRVYFLEGGALRSVASARLADVETAFALTVHKSQGSEFGHVLLVLPPDDSPLLSRELLYTAVTRARARFTLAAPQAAVLDAAVLRRTRRGSGLRPLLDQGKP